MIFRMTRTACFAVCWISTLIATMVMAAAPAADAASQPRRLALLIGCSRYFNLELRYQLPYGPDNDVKALRRLLEERFGFAPGDFTILVHANDPQLRPYHAVIVREMERLANSVRAGDEVVILFAGHGSQQPDDSPNDPNDYEPDGLDEVILPEDVTDWKPKEKVVGGITDDRIRGWLDRIRDRGASVFFVADCCHSGTMTRGPGDDVATGESDGWARYRHVPPEVLHPQDALERARQAAAGRQPPKRAEGQPSATRGSDVDRAPMKLLPAEQQTQAGGLAALFAVPDSQLEQQHAMPPPNGKGRSSVHGRLTYALQDVLGQAQQRLTYRELAQQIASRYQGWGWVPYSLIEATDPDREVLGKRDWSDRSRFQLTRDRDGQLEINAGLVHGLTPNSMLAVKSPIGTADPDRIHGYVKIIAADVFTAEAVPVKYGNGVAVAADNLPSPGRCEIIYRDYGDLKIAVRVREFPGDLAKAACPPLIPADETTLARVQQVVAGLSAGQVSLVRLAAEGEKADVYLLTTRDQVYLCLADIDLAAAVRDGQHIFAPDPIDDKLAATLKENLYLIGQGLNLRRLAGEGNGMAGAGADLKIQLQRQPASQQGWIPVTGPASSTFRNGDILAAVITNSGGQVMNLSVFYQDSRFKRGCFGPGKEQPWNGVFEVPANGSATVQIKINDSTTGAEDLLVFAWVNPPNAGVPIDMTFLKHPGLELAKIRGEERGQPHPLEALIRDAMYGSATRGLRMLEAPSLCVQRFTVTVVK